MNDEKRVVWLLDRSFSILLMGCTARSPLELALERAGDNRLELEKVFEHYREELSGIGPI